MPNDVNTKNLESFLIRWMSDGRLQTFEDRERFRREAGEMLARLPSETTPPSADWLWGQFMDFCRKRGVSPTQYGDLFEIVNRARQGQEKG